MNTYQQLALASSRGARIQFQPIGYHGQVYQWVLWDGIHSYYAKQGRLRIHPQDTHFRFGPISKRFYEAAKNPPANADDVLHNTTDLLRVYCAYGEWKGYLEANKNTRATYLLLMAEALASEGL